MVLPSALNDFLVPAGQQTSGAGADINELFKNDLLIPKIWLMQSESELIKEKKAGLKIGDFVSSLTDEKLAGPDEGLKFVVVKLFKKWQGFIVDRKGNKTFSKDHSGIMTLKNANWSYEEELGANTLTRRQVICAIVLLERDIIAQNQQPYCLDFYGYSKQGGRKLVSSVKSSTSKIIDGKYQLPSYAFAYSLTAKEESNDKGTFLSKDITGIGYSSKEAVLMGRDVYEFVKNNEDQIEIDERDVVNNNDSDDREVI